jgi:hypothetical protein
MENYWNNGNAVAFSRGNKGFFAMAKQGSMSESLQTGKSCFIQALYFIYTVNEFFKFVS